MKGSPVLWLVTLMVASAQARDPFVAPQVARCVTELPTLSQWHLQGVIGRDNDWRGWLLSPQGQVLAVVPESNFPVYPWQISEINGQSISFRATQSCEEGQFSLRLKGRFNEKDRHRHAVVADDQQPRQ